MMSSDWLRTVPLALEALTARWSLTSLSQRIECDDACCSWIGFAMRADGTSAVLKIGMPHTEGRDEIAGLRFWNGDGIVRLFDADEEWNAMLLERCEPGTSLRVLPEHEQDVVIASLLQRLWRQPSTSTVFRPLSTMLAHWSAETRAREEEWPDASLVQEGLRTFDDLARSTTKNVLLATDLHAGNVLRSQREPWLAIDPKPFVGDPAYDGTQHLLNCKARLRNDPRCSVERFADLLGVDTERLARWTFARLAAEPRDDWNNAEFPEVARRLSASWS